MMGARRKVMKKEIIICFFVIILVMTLNTITESHTEVFVDKIEFDLQALREDLISQKEDELMKKIDDVIQKWENEHEILASYIEHNELEKIEIYFWEVKSYLETKEYNMAVQGIDTSIFLMNHIKNRYKLSLRNIF